MKPKVFAALHNPSELGLGVIFFVVSAYILMLPTVTAEYTWNGSDWIWTDDNSAAGPNQVNQGSQQKAPKNQVILKEMKLLVVLTHFLDLF